MDYGTADGPGALRRERLRTARIYFVCDAMPHGEDPEPLLRSALDGGVDMIQLREKSGDDRLIERAAGTFRRLADTYSVPFIVNDDPELVERFGADGVHVGQDDMAISEVREIVGREALVGISTHSPEQLEDAIRAGGVDYLSTGPIWETPTKEGRPATGLDYISFAAKTTALPFFAIGGIDTGNVEEVLQAGARRLCVVRAIRDSDDPAATAASLRRAFASVGDEVAPGG